MNTLRSSLFALVAASSVMAQDGLAVDSVAGGGSGLVCAPWSCTPTTLSAPRGDRLALAAMGSVFEPRLLLISGSSAICVPVPGIGGALQVQQPVVLFQPFLWGRFNVSGAPGQVVCSGWIGMSSIPWPTTVPAGLRIVIQTLSLSTTGGLGLSAFSNAVEITAL